MGQIANQEPRSSDVDAQLVIYESGRLTLIEAAQIKSGLANFRSEVIRDQRVEFRVAVFHGHEAESTYRNGLRQLRISLPTGRS
jgi:hypothetical protein